MFLEKVLLAVVILSFPLIGGLNSGLTAKHLAKYAIAMLPTPVLHTPDFPGVFGEKEGSTLRLDEDNQIKELEFVALPKTVFKIEKIINKDGRIIIYKVTTKEYPYPTDKGYFIDSRFVKILKIKPPERQKTLPLKQTIIQNLLSAKGSDYLWGSNYKDGVPQMLSFYKPSSLVSLGVQDKWMLKGVDCSGLLYRATNGYTPRNTTSLISYGAPVRIADLKVDQVIKTVEPLDIIAWREHVVVILNKEHVIESRLDYDKHKKGLQGGVRIRRLKEVLIEIMERRIPVNSYKDKVEEGKKKFVIRRWYKQRQRHTEESTPKPKELSRSQLNTSPCSNRARAYSQQKKTHIEAHRDTFLRQDDP